jgi:hypothetical protein
MIYNQTKVKDIFSAFFINLSDPIGTMAVHKFLEVFKAEADFSSDYITI